MENKKVTMWLARDKDGDLYLYTHKPHKNTDPTFDTESWCTPDFVDDNDDIINAAEINPKFFPEVTWDTEPLEVELVPVKH